MAAFLKGPDADPCINSHQGHNVLLVIPRMSGTKEHRCELLKDLGL